MSFFAVFYLNFEAFTEKIERFVLSFGYGVVESFWGFNGGLRNLFFTLFNYKGTHKL